MALSDLELRILGALLEKERSTPETYPLTTNALLLACNQKTNRDPVTNYSERELGEGLQSLRDKGLLATSRAESERVYKHRHLLARAFTLDARGFALLAVLLLRGPQTPGELRTRSERYVSFGDLSEVEATLEKLAAHAPPLAHNHGRGPGQSQDRWGHTLGSDEEKQRPRARVARETTTELEDLRARLERLEQGLAEVRIHLGLSDTTG